MTRTVEQMAAEAASTASLDLAAKRIGRAKG